MSSIKGFGSIFVNNIIGIYTATGAATVDLINYTAAASKVEIYSVNFQVIKEVKQKLSLTFSNVAAAGVAPVAYVARHRLPQRAHA